MINEDLLEIQRLRAQLTDISSHALNIHVSGGTNSDKIERLIMEITVIESRVNENIDRLYEAKNDAIERINKINKPRFKDILYMRYIECRDIHSIALELKVSDSMIKKDHKKALDEYEKQI